ncbi:dipeptidyl-peptidase IV Serine peptidase. MEROPS family S15 [Micromonospora pattaloongensis]|uniref:Xaa-Pro dipeptidyl-peptidase n=1 Tax=Micromonospora pattaloongensis TaxID=405436 RepID=A0A1H3NRZ2_9ACTN|nr:Xaa-Pro dipeptidyl-peptidase [Micromonospora pattaloongensis]SDY91195.1 dipeptidyl-peptidase IV Serine peptidase. MEROPS family S15 [Micromonospora pattaloongensis]
MRQPRRMALFTAAFTGAALLAPPGSPASARPDTPPGIVVQDGMTQPIYSFADAIEERVYVETPLDTDNDGRRDRVAIDVSRPRETATAGLKVPVIFEHSPYRKGVWGDVPYPSVLVDELPQAGRGHGLGARSLDVAIQRAKANLPGSLDDYYVPRGYAVVLGQSIGTGDSDGCPTSGDRAETLGTKAVIDWLNGRAKGFTATGEPVTAGWTTGAVGMTGVSYNGTLPNMVATTGVAGLKTIIPVSAISSWYDYYRANGLVVAPGTYQGEDADVLAKFTAGQARAEGPCADEIARITEEQDRVTGDYTRFWRERDYRPDARNVRASVFVVHGLNDWNVKPENFAGWWDQLARFDVPRKIWLHQGGHGGPGAAATVTLPDGRSWTYRQTENRWFDYWLWNVRNGIMDEPTAVVQREDRAYTTYANWPDPAARVVPLRLTAADATAPGGLTADRARPSRVTQGFVDAGRTIGPDALVAGPDEASANRLVYRTAALPADVRMSGRPEMRLRMSIDNRADANLTVYLVDYGPAGSTGSPVVVTRGWMDPQNRISAAQGLPLKQGKMYDYRWTLEPKDYVFSAGHRIGVVVFSSDQEYTLLPLDGTRLTVAPTGSELRIPIVGGRVALGL